VIASLELDRRLVRSGHAVAYHAAGYGPAEVRDLATWAGVAAADARAAWRGAEAAEGGGRRDGVRLLGAFDPYLLGYAGRDHAVDAGHARRVWPGGGWFHPVVLVGGRAAGTWRIDGATLAVDAWAAIPGDGLAAEARDVGRFLGRALAVSRERSQRAS
jgi:hypothetical protein